jgi:porphobilinogen synthase
MPGVYQMSVDNIVRECAEVHSLGIPAVIFFGIPEEKDEVGSGAYDDNGIVQRALRAVRNEVPGLLLITDVCLCEYTSHGHCGIVRGEEIVNDESVELLAREALSHAAAGAGMVAPSDMFDGRVGVIRRALDENGFQNLPVMSYAAKYASGFYGPFREAAESTPKFGDRRSHQMDPANSDEALREVAQDIQEGADIVMVKPALPYLDVIYRVKERFGLPTAAYNVSGEYAMVKAAERAGWIDGERVMMEMLTGIRRAGADMILTYFAKEAAKALDRQQ